MHRRPRRYGRLAHCVAASSLLAVLLPVLLPVSPLPVGPASADPPPSTTERYSIRRNGTVIGSHVARFRRAGTRLTVEHTIEIRVRALFMEVFRYDLRSREEWDRGWLMSVRAHTSRTGGELDLRATAAERVILVAGEEGERAVPRQAVPSSPQWDVFEMRRTHMINAENGEVFEVRVGEPRSETLTIDGRAITCRRYSVSGDLQTVLWYREDGVMVRNQLTAPDGSTVVTELR